MKESELVRVRWRKGWCVPSIAWDSNNSLHIARKRGRLGMFEERQMAKQDHSTQRLFNIKFEFESMKT
jgi:hypothetical protein